MFLDRVVAASSVALLALGCNRERTARHEALAKVLAAPATLLCGESKEGGGCYADCQTRNAADHGASVVAAAKLVSSIPTFADPETEALLADVRAAGELAHESLVAACPKRIDTSGPIGPEVERCAEAARAHRARIDAFIDAFQRLTTGARERTGVEMPEAWQPCPPSSP